MLVDIPPDIMTGAIFVILTTNLYIDSAPAPIFNKIKLNKVLFPSVNKYDPDLGIANRRCSQMNSLLKCLICILIGLYLKCNNCNSKCPSAPIRTPIITPTRLYLL